MPQRQNKWQERVWGGNWSGRGWEKSTAEATLLPVCTTQWLYRAQPGATDLPVTASSAPLALKRSEVRRLHSRLARSEEVKGCVGCRGTRQQRRMCPGKREEKNKRAISEFEGAREGSTALSLKAKPRPIDLCQDGGRSLITEASPPSLTSPHNRSLKQPNFLFITYWPKLSAGKVWQESQIELH